MKNRAVLFLGSNILPEKNIPEARKRIKALVRVLSESAYVKTKPVGRAKQPDFINGAMLVETDTDQKEFKRLMKQIEDEMGRIRTRDKYAPRTIDLDIVVWNGRLVDHHVRTRDFLKKAVLEVCPEAF